MRERPGRNHLLWIGPLVVFVGAVSYFLVFARYPALRDFPWVNLPLVLLGVLLVAVGVRRTLARDSGVRKKIFGTLALVFSLIIAGLFCFYVFSLSYGMPEPSDLTAKLETAPDFSLADQDGRTVTLSDLRGRNVIIVFYRGHW
jgi:hypothetical protein